jgi:hypothetical protein
MSSYREIPTIDVIAACEYYLQRRKKRIEERREAMIYEKMNSGWKLFRSRTREDAIARLKSRDIGVSDWEAVEWSGSHWANKVKELLCLAKAPNGKDCVLVDAELADLLW